MILIAHVGLSYACNMHCKHCFVREKKDDYVLKHYQEIVDKLSELGVMAIYYTYGEPLICNKFFEVAHYCREKRISQVLMSNGYFINTSETVKKIKDAGIKKVYISLDSVNEYKHNENRGKKDAFEHAIRAIKLLKEEALVVAIANSISCVNIKEMKSMYKLGEKLGVEQISYLRIRDKDGIVDFTEKEKAEYFRVVEDLILRAKYSHTQVNFHDPTLQRLIEKMLNENTIESGFEVEKYRAMLECAMPFSISISPDGEISKCALSNHIIGNVKENGWKAVLEDKEKYLCVKCRRN